MDQARRVLDALRAGHAAEGTSPQGHPAESHPADCRWCPVCQAAAVLRGERPELTAALADVLTATAAALRAFAADPQSADPPAADPTTNDVDGQDGPPAPLVQRIDIA
jgi:hypothetical protein